VALAVSYFTANTSATAASTVLYTVSSTAYSRDLVFANGSSSGVYFNVGSGATGATTTASFLVPSGQQAVLMGQAPVSAKIYFIPAGGATVPTGTVSLGWASVVSVI
jgi:hypothetical protein